MKVWNCKKSQLRVGCFYVSTFADSPEETSGGRPSSLTTGGESCARGKEGNPNIGPAARSANVPAYNRATALRTPKQPSAPGRANTPCPPHPPSPHCHHQSKSQKCQRIGGRTVQRRTIRPGFPSRTCDTACRIHPDLRNRDRRLARSMSLRTSCS